MGYEYNNKAEFVAMLQGETRKLRELGATQENAFVSVLTDVLWQFDQFFLSVAKRLDALEDAVWEAKK